MVGEPTEPLRLVLISLRSSCALTSERSDFLSFIKRQFDVNSICLKFKRETIYEKVKMSIIPMVLNEVFDDFHHRPGRFFDRNFGAGLFADDLIVPSCIMRLPVSSHSRCRQRRQCHSPRNDGAQTVAAAVPEYQGGEFKVDVDVRDFRPENLNVKVVDNTVIIDGKHEERPDEHGYVSRQFTRRYVLPDTVDAAAIVSKLSSDGVLTVAAPKKAPALPTNERPIPIVQTQQPALVRDKKTTDKSANEPEKMEQ